MPRKKMRRKNKEGRRTTITTATTPVATTSATKQQQQEQDEEQEHKKITRINHNVHKFIIFCMFVSLHAQVRSCVKVEVAILGSRP